MGRSIQLQVSAVGCYFSRIFVIVNEVVESRNLCHFREVCIVTEREREDTYKGRSRHLQISAVGCYFSRVFVIVNEVVESRNRCHFLEVFIVTLLLCLLL